jgi:hypothetical protein
VSSGHDGGTRPGQTSKKSKDLSVREGEERGSGRGGVCMMCGRVSESRTHWVIVWECVSRSSKLFIMNR